MLEKDGAVVCFSVGIADGGNVGQSETEGFSEGAELGDVLADGA